MEVKPGRTVTTSAAAAANAPSSSVADYRRAREEFFARNGARWPGTLRDPFDILAPRVLGRTEVDEIRRAAAGLSRVFKQAAKLLRRLPDRALLEMGVPDYVLPAVRCAIPGIPDCLIGRFDLARTDGGYKLLEFNADVSGLLVEAFSINGEVCRDAGGIDPNDSQELTLARALATAVRLGFRHVGKQDGEQGQVVVAWFGGSRWGRGLAEHVSRLLAEFSARCLPVESLSIGATGLYDPNGKRIDVLYRVFPLHFLRDELFQSVDRPLGPGMGGAVLELVERQRLALINPPFAFLLENKALQALIWNLSESGQYFDRRHRRLIEQYMLPTFLDPPARRHGYVIKPVYGAEGDTVTIVGADGGVIAESLGTTHTGEPMVYQERVDLPAEEIMTEHGPRRLHLVTSCFLIAGVPSAICMRAGGAITDESAWVLPVCIPGCAC